jgi:phosphoribosylamine--glycine ligase
VRGLKADGLDYRGFLFVGTMLTEQGLEVIEFNVRLGDPEAEVVLPLCKADWPALLAAIASGELPDSAIELKDGARVAVVLASANYPYSKSEPAEIEGLERVKAQGLLEGSDPPVALYFNGVTREVLARENGASENTYRNYYDEMEHVRYLAQGGRILTISAAGSDLSLARRLAYEVAGNIRFSGMQLRTDIAKLR